MIKYQKQCEQFFINKQLHNQEYLKNIVENLSEKEFIDYANTLINEYYNYNQNIIKEYENYNNNKKIFLNIYENVYHQFIFNVDIYQKKLKEWHNYQQQQNYQKSLIIEINNETIIAEKCIDVLWSGWECDDKIWLVKHNNEMKLVTSNHGEKIFVDTSFLQNKIEEYQHAINQSNELINTVKSFNTN